jgi:hypothetical protein
MKSQFFLMIVLAIFISGSSLRAQDAKPQTNTDYPEGFYYEAVRNAVENASR